MAVTSTTKAPDGTKLGYRIWHGGKHHRVLLMIHGLASNLTRWSEFAENTSLRKSWNLLRVDLRGHGSSMYRGRINCQRWCDDITTILAKEGCSRAIILGHSLGAQVALQFAAMHPGKTRGLILIDPVFPEALRGSLALAKRLRWFITPTVWMVWLLNSLGLRRRSFPTRDLEILDRQTRSALTADANANIARLYMSPWEDLKYLPLANYLQDLNEVVRPIRPPPDLNTPILVLLSAGASVSDPKTTARLAAKLPHSETAVIDANHWLLTERPVEARRAIEEWCDGLSSHP